MDRRSIMFLTIAAGMLVFFYSFGYAEKSSVKLTVNTGKPAHSISSNLYGLFFEDINFAADGGLYAELIRNRSFEFDEGLFRWSKVEREGGQSTIKVLTAGPLNSSNPHYLRLSTRNSNGWAGIENPGYGGIPVKKGNNYLFSVYARSVDDFEGELFIRLEDSNGTIIGKSKVGKITDKWSKYSTEIQAEGSGEKARLVLLVKGKAVVDIDMVSLFPEDTWKNQKNGLRKDLVQMLAKLEPSFIRFPGGCIVEGKDLDNAYRWKDTIGIPAERKMNWNRWAGWENPPQYYQSYGLGFFEYFRLCEDLNAEPLPILNCGMSCQYQDAELVPMDQLDSYVRDALDLIEYANGSPESEWGAKRAEAGHPEPFDLKYLGIGNEQWGEEYFKRYRVFYNAIKEKYSDITLVTTSGPAPDGRWFDLAWGKFESGTPAEIIDEHYYRPPEWFLRNTDRYDSYDRSGAKILAGEYAAHNRDRSNNLYAALSEAAFLTGLERNSDIVVMSSYAPLFAKIGSTQWTPDLIWFDNTSVYGTPSYYVQKMFSRNKGTAYLKNELSDNLETQNSLGRRGRIGLSTWQTKAEFKDLKVARGEKVLFEMKDSAGWDVVNGQWKFDDGQCKQTDASVQGAACFAGRRNWKDYTLSLKARKTGGNEGFIIIFRRNDDDNGLQWNLGGWGNTRHAIQLIRGGNSQILTEKPGRIEQGRWYDIRIKVSGSNVKCFLDGEIVHNFDIPSFSTPRLFASSTLDEESGNVIIKVVNVSGRKVPINIELKGIEQLGSRAMVTTLTSESPEDENSLENPKKVSPAKSILEDVSKEFLFTFEPYSLTVLELQKEKKL